MEKRQQEAIAELLTPMTRSRMFIRTERLKSEDERNAFEMALICFEHEDAMYVKKYGEANSNGTEIDIINAVKNMTVDMNVFEKSRLDFIDACKNISDEAQIYVQNIARRFFAMHMAQSLKMKKWPFE
jgi:hypothetical protein